MTGATPTDAADRIARAVDATGQLVAAVRDDEWAIPTGCTGWTVRDLVGHLVGGNRAFAAMAAGEEPPGGDDPLGDDPLAAYRESGEALRAAFTRPGVLDEVFRVPAGTLPGAVVLHLRLTELLVHGWDLARATGRSTTVLPADLAEQELAFSRGQLDRMPPGRRPFAPPQPVADAAPAIDRLAALLGRPVTQ
jgi:uncharacterized protein (TIGR03086 family)